MGWDGMGRKATRADGREGRLGSSRSVCALCASQAIHHHERCFVNNDVEVGRMWRARPTDGRGDDKDDARTQATGAITNKQTRVQVPLISKKKKKAH